MTLDCPCFLSLGSAASLSLSLVLTVKGNKVDSFSWVYVMIDSCRWEQSLGIHSHYLALFSGDKRSVSIVLKPNCSNYGSQGSKKHMLQGYLKIISHNTWGLIEKGCLWMNCTNLHILILQTIIMSIKFHASLWCGRFFGGFGYRKWWLLYMQELLDLLLG